MENSDSSRVSCINWRQWKDTEKVSLFKRIWDFVKPARSRTEPMGCAAPLGDNAGSNGIRGSLKVSGANGNDPRNRHSRNRRSARQCSPDQKPKVTLARNSPHNQRSLPRYVSRTAMNRNQRCLCNLWQAPEGVELHDDSRLPAVWLGANESRLRHQRETDGTRRKYGWVDAARRGLVWTLPV